MCERTIILQQLMDPSAALTNLTSANAGLMALASAIGCKDLIVGVLGPTCDFAGAELCAFTERRAEQFRRILERAAKFVRGDDTQVPIRVPRDVIYDGTLRTDALSAAYFGGVLASSKSGIDHDDRGSHHLATIERLSYYQLKAHWLIYSAVSRIMQESKQESLPVIAVDRQVWISTMRSDEALEEDTYTLHALQPLNREHLMHSWTEMDWATLKLTPFYPGVELFLWANGLRSARVSALATLFLEDGDLPMLPEGSYRKL